MIDSFDSLQYEKWENAWTRTSCEMDYPWRQHSSWVSFPGDRSGLGANCMAANSLQWSFYKVKEYFD